MADICGHPMLWHVVRRVQAINRLDGVALAIPETPADDCLQSIAQELGIACVRGSEYDVLQRYYRAAQETRADVIVRVTSDCPLFDPWIGNRALMQYLSTDADYVCAGAGMLAAADIGFPQGTDLEIMSYRVLECVWREAKSQYNREHVTPFIYQHPELFNIGTLKPIGRERRPELKFSVDTEKDLELVRAIYGRLYKDKPFSLDSVILMLDRHPELLEG